MGHGRQLRAWQGVANGSCPAFAFSTVRNGRQVALGHLGPFEGIGHLVELYEASQVGPRL